MTGVHDIGPLDPSLKRLLDMGNPGDRTPLQNGTAERLFYRVTATVAGLAPLDVGTDVQSTAPEPADLGPEPGSAPAASASQTIGSLLANKTAAIAVAFALGGAAGAGVHATAVRSGTPSVTSVSSLTSGAPGPSTDPSITALSATATPSSPPPEATNRPQHSLLSGDPSAAAQTAMPGRDESLGAERALVEMARTALARGQPDLAIAALQKHARQFPRARLAEEREALWIQALVLSGKGREAEQRAGRFKNQFPQSLMTPAVEQATEPEPKE